MNEEYDCYLRATSRIKDIFDLYENMIAHTEDIFEENVRNDLAEDCVNAALDMYKGNNPVRFLMTMKGEIDRKIKELENN